MGIGTVRLVNSVASKPNSGLWFACYSGFPQCPSGIWARKCRLGVDLVRADTEVQANFLPFQDTMVAAFTTSTLYCTHNQHEPDQRNCDHLNSLLSRIPVAKDWQTCGRVNMNCMLTLGYILPYHSPATIERTWASRYTIFHSSYNTRYPQSVSASPILPS